MTDHVPPHLEGLARVEGRSYVCPHGRQLTVCATCAAVAETRWTTEARGRERQDPVAPVPAPAQEVSPSLTLWRMTALNGDDRDPAYSVDGWQSLDGQTVRVLISPTKTGGPLASAFVDIPVHLEWSMTVAVPVPELTLWRTYQLTPELRDAAEPCTVKAWRAEDGRTVRLWLGLLHREWSGEMAAAGGLAQAVADIGVRPEWSVEIEDEVVGAAITALVAEFQRRGGPMTHLRPSRASEGARR